MRSRSSRKETTPATASKRAGVESTKAHPPGPSASQSVLVPAAQPPERSNVLLGPLPVDPLEDGPGGLPDLLRERVPREGLRR